jgi:hypothetical protein
LHIGERLTPFAASGAGLAGIIVEVARVSLKAGDAEIVLIAVEATRKAEVVELRKIDIVFDVLLLKLNLADTVGQGIAQSASEADVLALADDAVGCQAERAAAK